VVADLVITGGLVMTGDSSGGAFLADVVVDDGRLTALVGAGEAPPARQVIDAYGLHVLPGLVDAHVHFDDPGRADWEGWATGSLAAAAGGVTTVVDMPIDSDPPTVDPASLNAKAAAASAASLVDFGLWAGLVPGNRHHLGPMADLGATGFKAFACDSGWDAFPPVDEATLVAGLQVARDNGLPVALHAEDPAVLASKPWRPAEAELAAVRWAVRLAAAAGAHLHLVHLSSVDAVDEAARWSNVTTETCPHYLVLDDRDAARIGPAALVAPPIRDRANLEALWAAVASGRVDCIASDHSPCPAELKQGPSPFAGIAGVETGLAALLSTRRLPLSSLVTLMTAAAGVLRLPRKGRLRAGFDADIVLFDAACEWRLDPGLLHGRQRLSPFAGRPMIGRVHRTIVRGQTVYNDGEQASEPIGRLVRPDPRLKRLLASSS
jgi:allantoinase